MLEMNAAPKHARGPHRSGIFIYLCDESNPDIPLALKIPQVVPTGQTAKLELRVPKPM